MPRYYDIDKLKEMIEAKADTLIEGKESFLYVAKWLELLPPADVAPKSEVERLKVEGGILEQECGKLMGTVASLEIELAAMRTAANSYKMHYENLAREIFEEIERLAMSKIDADLSIAQLNDTYYIEAIDELKKKYLDGDSTQS